MDDAELDKEIDAAVQRVIEAVIERGTRVGKVGQLWQIENLCYRAWELGIAPHEATADILRALAVNESRAWSERRGYRGPWLTVAHRAAGALEGKGPFWAG